MLVTLIMIFLFLVSVIVYYFVSSMLKWQRNVNRRGDPGTNVEPVSIIIAAYNEEDYLVDKLTFLLSEKEWIPESELIVISAGSTDRTNSFLLQFENDERVTRIILKEHLTKPQALNRAVSIAKNRLLVFSDCRQRLSEGAVRVITSYFENPTIGAVNATISDTKYGGKVSLLRRISNMICLSESFEGSSLNLHGAFYALRKVLFKPFPVDLIHDDLFTLVNTVAQKKRLIQTDKVLVYDMALSDYYEKSRIDRLVKGLLSFAYIHWDLIRQLEFKYKIRFLLFKYAKLTIPFIGLAVVVPIVNLMNDMMGWQLCTLVLAGPIILTLLFRKGRKFLAFFLRIQFYFVLSTFKFVVLNQRTGYYVKLSVKTA